MNFTKHSPLQLHTVCTVCLPAYMQQSVFDLFSLYGVHPCVVVCPYTECGRKNSDIVSFYQPVMLGAFQEVLCDKMILYALLEFQLSLNLPCLLPPHLSDFSSRVSV